MKVITFSRICLIGALLSGLFVAWDACLGQTDVSKLVGRCTYGCHKTPCDWHDVKCAAQPGKSCTHNAGCCRGPGTGDGYCQNLWDGTHGQLYQCVYTNCVPRNDELCWGE